MNNNEENVVTNNDNTSPVVNNVKDTTVNNKKPNKNNIIIIAVVVVLLIVCGAFFLLNNKSDGNTNNNTSDNDNTQVITKEQVNKITIDDLNNTNAKIIVQYLLDTELKDEKWEVIKAYPILTQDFTEYVVNIEAKHNSLTYNNQSIIKNKNGEWSMELPMWIDGDRDISMYTSYISFQD